MRSTTCRAAVSAAVVLTSALLVTACDPGAGKGSGGGATAGASTTGGTSASTAPGGGSSGGTSVGTSGGTSGGGTSGGSTTSGGTSTGGTTASGAACHNLVAGAGVKGQVTSAYEAESHRGHIMPRPQQFLYGECGGTLYAATAFDLTADATYNDQVASQDDGSTRKYFKLASGGSWTVIGSADFPDNGGCIAQVPQALAKLWGNCQPGRQ